MGRARFVPLAIFVVTALVLSVDLGGQYVWTRDEARDGLVARDILEHRHWLIPHVGGRVYPYKPPLFHWLVALSSPRGVTEWSLRFPSVLAAAGVVALTYATGLRFGSPLTGLMAAAVLASSATFVEWARVGRLEMLLLLWLTLALWSGLRWLDEGRRRHVVVLGLALGLGCLTKGPVGLAPLAAVIIAVTLLRRWSRRVVTDLALAFALAAALPATWLALATVAQSGLPYYVNAVVANFGSELKVIRDQHPLFALEEIGLGFLPWTLALPATAVVLVRRWRTSWRLLLLPMLWSGLVLVTFTVVVSPRAVYFLPVYPQLALLVAWAWSVASAPERRGILWPMVAVIVALTVVGAGLTVWPQTLELKREITPLGRDLGIGIAVIGIAGLLVLAVLRRRRGRAGAPVVIGIAALLALVVLQVTVRTPRANRAHPAREVAARFVAGLPSQAEVAYVDRGFTTGLMFYVKQRQLELPPITEMPYLLQHPLRYALVPRDVVTLVWPDGFPGPTLREESVLDGRYVLLGLDGTPMNAGFGPYPGVQTTVSAELNKSVFGVGDDLVATAGVENPGYPPGAKLYADLYLGMVLPDSVTIVFYTGPGAVDIGVRSDLRTFRPYRSSVPLTEPFTVKMPRFYSRRWVGTDPRGNYVFFHLALQSGAAADGLVTSSEVLGLSQAPFSFP